MPGPPDYTYCNLRNSNISKKEDGEGKAWPENNNNSVVHPWTQKKESLNKETALEEMIRRNPPGGFC